MTTHKSSLFLEIDTDDTYTNNYMNNNLSPFALSPASYTPITHTVRKSNVCDDDDGRILYLTREMENLNNSTTKQCTIHHESEKVGMGSSASIYEMSGNPNSYVKISNLPYDSYMLSKSIPSGITCEMVGDRLNVSINEIKNALKYEKLSYAFPHNIMRIESAERCQKSYNGSPFFANKFVIEKVSGTTLDKAIDVMTEQELICCVMQLVYILSYANMHGYFHNDITCSNVMIYYGENDNLMFNKLFLLDNIIHCNFHTTSKLPIVKLIDFSYSEYINYNAIHQMKDSVVIGEPQQILKMIKNRLNRAPEHLRNSLMFQQIYDLFELINAENSLLKFKYLELEAQMSSVGFRTLTESEIINLSIPKHFAESTILKCFRDLKQIFEMRVSYGIAINIINSNSNLPIINKKITKPFNPVKQIGDLSLPEIESEYKRYAHKTRSKLEEFYTKN